jgi:hypothetical protein
LVPLPEPDGAFAGPQLVAAGIYIPFQAGVLNQGATVTAKELQADWAKRMHEINGFIARGDCQLVITSDQEIGEVIMRFALSQTKSMPDYVLTPAADDVTMVSPSDTSDRLETKIPVLGWLFIPKALDLDPIFLFLQENKGVQARTCDECPDVFMIVEDEHVETVSHIHDLACFGGSIWAEFKNLN